MVILVDLLACNGLLEEGGTALTFEGSDKRCTWKSALRVHNSSFYWKSCALDLTLLMFLYIGHIWSWYGSCVLLQVATEGDLGLADAFINGDISFVDKN